ncbi:MAG: hypothetical protein H0T42_18740 [Deltaproteobacteria bacterium]|nr:hypothetical protein [Deltaproteobacteria bacterium]
MLYHDGQRVNGPDAALYSRAKAEGSCSEAARLVPGVRVECRYNGQTL